MVTVSGDGESHGDGKGHDVKASGTQIDYPRSLAGSYEGFYAIISETASWASWCL